MNYQSGDKIKLISNITNPTIRGKFCPFYIIHDSNLTGQVVRHVNNSFYEVSIPGEPEDMVIDDKYFRHI